ncbi:MAG: 3-hydroxyacyl-[acyl-carrier-protein] dehydratase [Candidatus Tokpelaia sp. JSC085]|nr:MAG: 3-hydroxyacyl-[acyl-carrier-protein] dehydratase [Candidatus Tokpelaia sp. JSC085]
MSDKTQNTDVNSAEIQQLISALPHRYPFLLVDRIQKINGNNSAVGLKNVTFNEPHFMGHFPENPIMPGVLIIEAMAQTAGVICLLQRCKERKPMVRFMSIRHAKFREPVIPGDQLIIHVKKLQERKNVFRYQCEARVEDKVVAEAELTAMISIVSPDRTLRRG